MRVHSITGIQRCMSAALALWMAVFSVGIHGMHTCALHGHASAYFQNEVRYGAGNCPFCRNPSCGCRSLRFSGALFCKATPPRRIARIAGAEKDGCCCLACRYLAQPQSLASIATPLMSVGCLSAAVVHVQIDRPVSSPAYSPIAPRAPPMSLA